MFVAVTYMCDAPLKYIAFVFDVNVMRLEFESESVANVPPRPYPDCILHTPKVSIRLCRWHLQCRLKKRIRMRIDGPFRLLVSISIMERLELTAFICSLRKHSLAHVAHDEQKKIEEKETKKKQFRFAVQTSDSV